MKKILPILILILIIPQIAMAAWWNPLSWFNSWSFFHKNDTTTQVLESRIKELESKLSTSTTTATISNTINKTAPKDTVIPKTQSETPVSVSTQSTSQIPIIPSDWIKPGGGIYTSNEIIENRKAKCASQNMALDGTVTDGIPNCISYDKVCSNKYPNAVFSKLDASGVPSCDCKTGYVWNNSRTSCQVQQQNSYDNSDPYGVSSNSGIHYSPDELNAIDCAYYGTNCAKTGTVINNYYQITPAQAPVSTVNCANYQVEKNNLDNYYSQSGTLFSGARTNAYSALEAKYSGCF